MNNRKTINNDRIVMPPSSMPKKRRSAKRGFTSKTASKARHKWLDAQKFVATSTQRIHVDAIAIAKSAWPNRFERVSKMSEAIRRDARKELGME